MTDCRRPQVECKKMLPYQRRKRRGVGRKVNRRDESQVRRAARVGTFFFLFPQSLGLWQTLGVMTRAASRYPIGTKFERIELLAQETGSRIDIYLKVLHKESSRLSAGYVLPRPGFLNAFALCLYSTSKYIYVDLSLEFQLSLESILRDYCWLFETSPGFFLYVVKSHVYKIVRCDEV